MNHYTYRELREAAGFIFPLLFFVSVFILFPVLGSFWNSLWQDTPFLTNKFLALSSYARLFKDGLFWEATRFSLLFVLVSVPLELVFGMIFAIILNERSSIRWLLRTVVLLPWAIPVAIGARVWQLIYNYDYGPMNFIATKLTGAPVNWLGSSLGAFFSLVLADVWKTTPFVTIILLAGLQAVPEDLYKQAKIDGTNFIQRFFRITLPIVKPIIIVALLFRTIDAIRIFDLIYVLTGGGPGGATTSISLYGYKYFLLGDFGYGSSVSIILFLIAFGLAFLYIKLGKFREAVL